ncbi:GIY-YIG nuclease family protein [bacterium]|jgi:putative endonuclease|nr:GIY-YIG nuclease family protein [bacterium]
MKYSVYMILTKINNRYISYVGYTNNIHKRLTLHNSSKGAKFTKGKKWNLIFLKEFSSRISAMKFEYFLKKDRKLRNSIKFNNIKK